MPVERECKGTALRIKSVLGVQRLLRNDTRGSEIGIMYQTLEVIIFTPPLPPKYPRNNKPVWSDRHVRRHTEEAVQCKIMFFVS